MDSKNRNTEKHASAYATAPGRRGTPPIASANRIVAKVVKSEVLNLRSVDHRIDRVFDVGDGLAFKLSLQVDKHVRLVVDETA
jgi:hypothetical protein